MKIEVGDIIAANNIDQPYIGIVIAAHEFLKGFWRMSVYSLLYEYYVVEDNIYLHVPGSNFKSVEEKIDYIKVIKKMS
jgi:hypothetical protein